MLSRHYDIISILLYVYKEDPQRRPEEKSLWDPGCLAEDMKRKEDFTYMLRHIDALSVCYGLGENLSVCSRPRLQSEWLLGGLGGEASLGDGPWSHEIKEDSGFHSFPLSLCSLLTT